MGFKIKNSKGQLLSNFSNKNHNYLSELIRMQNLAFIKD